MQLWKLDGKKLINKAELWASEDDFEITLNGSFYLIENISKKKVLGINGESNVVVGENFVEDKDGQLWKKGELNIEGYFTLAGSKSQKVMTAVSEEKIKMEGKLLLGQLVNYCFSLNTSIAKLLGLKNYITYFFLEILT